jgi:hypothetical protein
VVVGCRGRVGRVIAGGVTGFDGRTYVQLWAGVVWVRSGTNVLTVERDFEWRVFAEFVFGSFGEPVPLEYES